MKSALQDAIDEEVEAVRVLQIFEQKLAGISTLDDLADLKAQLAQATAQLKARTDADDPAPGAATPAEA